MPRDELELFIESELGELQQLRLTSGSGNQFGDGDIKPIVRQLLAYASFGYEAKRTSTSRNHLVKWNDWEKARKQIHRQDNIPILVTQNSMKHRMVHLEFDDWKQLMQLLKEMSQWTPAK